MARLKLKSLYAALIAATMLLCTACGNNQQAIQSEETTMQLQNEAEESNSEPEAEWIALGRSVKIDGTTWRYKSSIKTVLFLGVDSREQIEYQSIMGTGGRSDTIIIFLVDTEAKTVRMMPISRDTIAKVDIYNTKQEYITSGNMQITMQYAFGNSAARSCWLSKKAVTELLHDLPITSYCSLTLDGISAAVELLGGITLTLEEDWTDIDSAYRAGTTITMDAAQVERFLRYRDTETFASNNVRMSRQIWFIHKLFEQMGKAGKIGTDILLDYLSPYLETDMDGDTIKQITTYDLISEVVDIPGHDVEGEYNDEFYVDDEALLELLLSVFYQRVE